jgi:hypothetical protein
VKADLSTDLSSLKLFDDFVTVSAASRWNWDGSYFMLSFENMSIGFLEIKKALIEFDGMKEVSTISSHFSTTCCLAAAAGWPDGVTSVLTDFDRGCQLTTFLFTLASGF